MTKFFFENRVARSPGGGHIGATVEFFQSVWTIGKPKVSTFQICMAVLGRLTPAWSGRTVIGRRSVKKMTKLFFSEPGCQKYRGG